ncbi:MAG: hypothetical protein AB1792_07645 [Candidatus Zixiibacteriota bacterium]
MRKHIKFICGLSLFLACGLIRGPVAWGEPIPPPFRVQPFLLASGTYENHTGTMVEAFSQTIRFDGAAWLHFRFDTCVLGARSVLEIRSLQDDGIQRRTAKTLAAWSNMSAIFNGDAVEITLHVAPGDTGIHFSLSQVHVGSFLKGDETSIKSLCGGDDDRGPSTDSRVGRLFYGGCTAWLTANSSFITAGHCCDWDPDDGGPQLPDGVLDLWGVVEFNIPQSLANGTTVAAAPEDQYPIITSNVTWEFPGSGGDIGDDWCVFEVGANSNTGLLPYQAQNFFRLSTVQPPDDATIRITGCGIDETPPGSTGGRNSDNMTLQTASGEYKGVDINDGKIVHEYRVDTEGGSSGSPIIYNTNGHALGVHTNSGCDVLTGRNKGTAFGRIVFYNAVNGFLGSSARYVDNAHISTGETGAIFDPYLSVQNGATGIATSGHLCIAKGTYDETLVITKAMTLRAPVGNVYIGSPTPLMQQEPTPSAPDVGDEQLREEE